MKTKYEIKFTIPNPIGILLYKSRCKKLDRLWYACLPDNELCLKQSTDDHAYFKWNQLVTQELKMWLLEGKEVTFADLNYIYYRRGFDEQQTRFIIKALGLVNLTKIKTYEEFKDWIEKDNPASDRSN